MSDEILPQEQENPSISPQLINSKGRIPSGVSDKVKEIRKQKHKEAMAQVKKEQQAIIKETKLGARTPTKLDLFLEQFLKNGGNATNAAMLVFNCKNRESAAVVGSFYLKKAKELGKVYLDYRDVGYGKLIDHAINRMQESEGPEWWDRLAKISGYWDLSDGKKSGPQIVNVVQSEKQVLSKYIQDAELLEDIEGAEAEVEEEAELENTKK